MPNTPSRMKRRRFVTLMALSGAALIATPLSRAAAAVSRGTKTAATRRREPSAAVRREILSQQKALAGQLKTLRSYPLPPGSPMAFVWKPLRARRGR